jgi:hypothetical protein
VINVDTGEEWGLNEGFVDDEGNWFASGVYRYHIETREQIVETCDGIKGCIVWALNMQEYGGFIVDNSDHPKTYAEGDATAQWEPSVWTRNMLRNIPQDWYVVIDWDHPSTEVQ